MYHRFIYEYADTAHGYANDLPAIQRFQARGESAIVPGSVAETRTSSASIITVR
jgi:hypothetical protein